MIAHSSWTDRNPAMERLLAATLARDYHPIAQLPHRVYTGGHDRLVIWRRDPEAHARSHMGLGNYQTLASIPRAHG
ncbi:hypothetical protein EWE75_10550 [Sphingomonas populi]|uniref:Uncharacterized protein n=1 Tax=Sphingomonas populi TaxID=2484750 RepID=A0A4Q6Y5X2_9SPHN|nr:hypothetical protein [Sphingomonas populi]RZF64596.1 hypothetical protein EWE75_10550 [Sphingomonas populi]